VDGAIGDLMMHVLSMPVAISITSLMAVPSDVIAVATQSASKLLEISRPNWALEFFPQQYALESAVLAHRCHLLESILTAPENSTHVPAEPLVQTGTAFSVIVVVKVLPQQ
jgi:hypothetical protein